MYRFEIGELAVTQQSRSLYRAVEKWLVEKDSLERVKTMKSNNSSSGHNVNDKDKKKKGAAASAGDSSKDNGDSSDDEIDELVGPRVTFFDAEDMRRFKAQKGLPPLPPKDSVSSFHMPSHSISDPNSVSANSSPPPSINRHHHSHRRNKSLNEPPGRAVDVGLVWWTGDLHGMHL